MLSIEFPWSEMMLPIPLSEWIDLAHIQSIVSEFSIRRHLNKILLSSLTLTHHPTNDQWYIINMDNTEEWVSLGTAGAEKRMYIPVKFVQLTAFQMNLHPQTIVLN